MFSKIINLIKNYKKDEVVQYEGEYELLVKNKRIVDFSSLQNDFKFDIKIGMYHDTYRYLTAGFNTDTQEKNIVQLLTVTSEVYRQMLKEKFEARSTQEYLNSRVSKDYCRVQELYEVEDIKLPESKRSGIFCMNLMVRLSANSYLAIGKKPKGRITREQRIRAIKNQAKKWEDFKHL